MAVKKKTSARCTAAPTVRYGGFGVLPNKQKPGGFLRREDHTVCRKGTTRHCLLLSCPTIIHFFAQLIPFFFSTPSRLITSHIASGHQQKIPFDNCRIYVYKGISSRNGDISFVISFSLLCYIFLVVIFTEIQSYASCHIFRRALMVDEVKMKRKSSTSSNYTFRS